MPRYDIWDNLGQTGLAVDSRLRHEQGLNAEKAKKGQIKPISIAQ